MTTSNHHHHPDDETEGGGGGEPPLSGSGSKHQSSTTQPETNESASGGENDLLDSDLAAMDSNIVVDNDDSQDDDDDDDEDTATVTRREPFWAFVPALGRWGCNILRGEAHTAAHAVTHCAPWFRGYLIDTGAYYRQHPKTLYAEIISGFTVAIMQVPESIAFSFVAGVPPLSGLQATFWMATITGLLGGKPGMISGAAGALAVVATDLTRSDGVLEHLTSAQRLNALYMTMFVCGLMQIAFAVLRLAKLVRLIPETGMIGFMNGLAIIIFLAQLPAFQYCPDEPLFVDCTVQQRQWLTFGNSDTRWPLVLTLVQVAVCMAIMHLFPKLPRRCSRVVPASLVALLVGTLIEHTLYRNVFGVSTRTVQETAPLSGSLPKFHWPAIDDGDGGGNNNSTLSTVLVYAVMLAAIGSVESVLTLQACNEITDTVPQISESNQELFAQGLANLVSGLFSAMGGDAMIGQSTINIMNGARHRVSSTMSGVFMLLFVVALSPFIELLPVGTLTGVLFMVVLSTFQWKTFLILRYGRLSDSGVILIVTLIAVFFNLAVAIAAGVIFSALVHAWDAGRQVDADVAVKLMEVNGTVCEVKYVHVKGSIFFGSARHFIHLFSVADDPDTVIIDFKDALVIDHSAVAAIEGVSHRFAKAGKRVLLTNLPVKSHGRMHRTHGDHAVLQRQIVAKHENFQDVDDDVDGDNDNDNNNNDEDEEDARRLAAPSPVLSYYETAEGHNGPAAGDVEVPIHRLGDLPMFRQPLEQPDSELQHFLHHQAHGHARVHEVKKDT